LQIADFKSAICNLKSAIIARYLLQESTNFMPHPTLLLAPETAFLVIDVQEKLMAKIPSAATVIRNIAFLIDGMRLLDVPVSATEQYPKGLGPTVAELAQRLPERPDKLAFSSCAVPGLVEGWRRLGRGRIVVTGIESHVCVLHTALDLLAADFQVYLPVDALASRAALDHDMALRRLEQAGAVLTTAETVLFELTGGAGHPRFKQISLLVQERMKGRS
jgi:nicotinamidase-related amidase